MKFQFTTSEVKESLLVIMALIWGAILLLPGDSFSSPSRVDALSYYAPDTLWGVLLWIFCGPFLLINRLRWRRYRKAVHIFLWIFWLGISFIALYRSAANGYHAVDFLIILPFLSIALMHAVIYTGLSIGRETP